MPFGWATAHPCDAIWDPYSKYTSVGRWSLQGSRLLPSYFFGNRISPSAHSSNWAYIKLGLVPSSLVRSVRNWRLLRAAFLSLKAFQALRHCLLRARDCHFHDYFQGFIVTVPQLLYRADGQQQDWKKQKQTRNPLQYFANDCPYNRFQKLGPLDPHQAFQVILLKIKKRPKPWMVNWTEDWTAIEQQKEKIFFLVWNPTWPLKMNQPGKTVYFANREFINWFILLV